MGRMRWLSVVVLALLLGACADAGLRREVASLRKQVDELTMQQKRVGAHAEMETRLARVEKFLGPYMNQPPPPAEPDPAVTYSVPVHGDAIVGAADAPVTLVLGYDYACPYCSRLRPTLAELRTKYGANLRIVYKNMIVHPETATLPAMAACAANQQGKFAEMDELLWTRGFEKSGYSKELVLGLASELHLDRARFESDLDGSACTGRIEDDMKVLQGLHVNGTPTSFINGRFIGGAQPVEAFQKLIDEELARAKERIAAGTPAADYYEKFVVEKGQSFADD